MSEANKDRARPEGACSPTGAAAIRRVWGPAALGWVLGTALQLAQTSLWLGWAYGAMALLALMAGVGLMWTMPSRPRSRWGWLPVAAALAFAATGGRAVGFAAQALPPTADGALVQAAWRVVAMPSRGEQSATFEAQLLQARTRDGHDLPIQGTIRWTWRSFGGVRSEAAVPRLLPGETWQGSLRLRAPRGLANPYGFDAEAWLWREGIVATGSVLQGGRNDPPHRLADDPWRHPVERARTIVRDAIVERLQPRYPPASVGLVAALVTGDQGAIPAADWAAIRATGVAHLVSISGLHVTMFALIATVAAGLVWRGVGRRWPAALLHWPVPVVAGVGGITLATAYALFAGWGVPAQRTATMLALVVALRLSGRRWPWGATWLAAMVVALILDPWALLQPGFWLSFVAVAVLFGQGGASWQPTGLGQRLRHAVADLLRVQAIVTAALAPLTLLLFGQVSVVGLLANLIAIPWVTLALTPVALAGVAVAPLWDAAAWLAQALLSVLRLLAAWPMAVWERPAPPLPLATAACIGAVLLVWRAPWRWRVWGLWMLWPVLAYRPPAPPPGTFEVLLPDVGQGSAAIVRTARHTLVFDSGPPMGRSDAAERVLLPWLRALGSAPQAIVISHDDSDHAGGLSSLFQAFPTATWWTSFEPGARLAGSANTCAAGVSWEWDGVSFQFLHPPTPDWAPPRQGGDNARSCVLQVGRGRASALLTGDIRSEEEAMLLDTYPTLEVGLLVAAHHGSQTSTSERWLKAIKPEWVAIQAGWRNRYGHPHPAVLRRLNEHGFKWVNTATCGAMAWSSAHPAQATCEREERRRYWRANDADDRARTAENPNGIYSPTATDRTMSD
ncbi:MAG: DNA internalization-related competence protein ComEC/Rec2 [Tepidimonas sp.]|uniref:DNA internalization-related competence protein ComEC/Rec2 n=1 Tax=Tepidimonas sp. TaxID=2002775 RepID=UPI00259F70E9|nr:DNA internalization-related competence protein ComEC/Rec2 [Tepidimonas sp.]MDM7456465.1 DNA internalization-related competence protein ComEC/Rec2 [Tepidimonas sp.]